LQMESNSFMLSCIRFCKETERPCHRLQLNHTTLVNDAIKRG